MNIVKMRQEDRKLKIAKMEKSIKRSKNPDLDKLVMLSCAEWGISMRTAKEYLQIALFNVKNK